MIMIDAIAETVLIEISRIQRKGYEMTYSHTNRRNVVDAIKALEDAGYSVRRSEAGHLIITETIWSERHICVTHGTVDNDIVLELLNNA